MALKGSLEDFSIVNILQMIKLEGKTGKLLLNDKTEEVKITFDKGMIIFAEGTPAVDDARIEHTLVNNALIMEENFSAIKKEHEDKLKPYWELLSKVVEPPVLVELINRQTVDTVYFGLRWVKGTYEFTTVKNLRYNNKVMRPMDVDGILMEGCRIADEWTRVAASIPSFDTFVQKNILGDGEEQDSKKDLAPKDFKNSLEFDVLTARGIKIKESQVTVLAVIGAGKTISEILGSARQGSFTTLEALSALLTMGVLKASRKKGKAMMKVDNSSAAIPMLMAVVLAGLIAFGGYRQFFSSQESASIKESANIVKNQNARLGLGKLERSMKVYLIMRESMPESIDDLIASGVITIAESVDPWENPYVLEVDKQGYLLYSLGPDIGLQSDNVYLGS